MKISNPRIWLLLLLVSTLFSSVVFSQPELEPTDSLIEREFQEMIRKSVWNPEPFFVEPRLRLLGGYDSNAFATAQDPISDNTFVAGPGATLTLPVGSRLLLQLREDADFTYYQEQDELRGVYTTTGVGLVFGGRRLLFRLDNTFVDSLTRPSTEFDFPVEQRTNLFAGSFNIVLGDINNFEFFFNQNRYRIQDTDVFIDEIPVQERLDRDIFRYGGRLTRPLTENASFVVEGFYDQLDFASESVQPDADIYGAQAGFSFSARGNIQGSALIGYQKITPDVPEEAEFSGLVGQGSLFFRLGERTVLGVRYERDAEPSVTNNNWFYVENLIGGSLEVFVTRRFSLLGRITASRNNYPRSIVIENDIGQTATIEPEEEFLRLGFGADFRLTRAWVLTFGGEQQYRYSNIPNQDEERLVLFYGVALKFP